VKRVLIPTNLEITSLNLIKYGLQFFKGEACEIFLLSIIPIPSSIPDLLLLPRDEGRLENTSTAFNKAVERMKKAYAVEISSLSVLHWYGDSTTKFNSFVKDNNIDLVLCPVALHPIDKKAEPPMFQQLAQNAACPVLYVPDSSEQSRLRKVAYVVDLDEKRSLFMHDMLLKLASANDFQLTFLIVFKPGSDLEKLRFVFQNIYGNEKLKKLNCSVHFVQESDPYDGISNFVDEYQADMLVYGKKKSFFGSLFSNACIAPDTAKSKKIPFLAIS
jgi:hypothetical protein